jgi:serine/threonine-protein kinase 11
MFNFNCNFFRYNIATGLYPFEGDNIYWLLENIGKGIWSVPAGTKFNFSVDYEILTQFFVSSPSGLDPLLTDLLLNMLRFEATERYTIQQIRNHSWFLSSPIDTGDRVPVPPLQGDVIRSSTVLPYLESYHYESRQNDVYFTEHDLNGKKKI